MPQHLIPAALRTFLLPLGASEEGISRLILQQAFFGKRKVGFRIPWIKNGVKFNPFQEPKSFWGQN
jgi:hypothetical protein